MFLAYPQLFLFRKLEGEMKSPLCGLWRKSLDRTMGVIPMEDIFTVEAVDWICQ